jgi:DNA polymerase III subunit delta
MWQLLHGPNALDRDEAITRLKAKLGAPDIVSLNTTVIERGEPLKNLMSACDSMPFLAEQRLILARGFVAGLKAGAGKKRGDAAANPDDKLRALLDYLPQLPESALLLLIEDDTYEDKHALVKLAADKKNGGAVKLYALPADPVKWLVERAKAKGAELSGPAAQALSLKVNRGSPNDRDHVVADSRTYLHKLDNELEKLVAYAQGRRIEGKDVDLLVADEDVADIFKFIDAISLRNADEALRVVRGVITRGESPLVVLSHIARQMRILIQIKEHPDLHGDALAQAIGVHPYVAKKAGQQAGRFGMREMHGAMQALLDTDIAIKTGRMDELAALDVLIAALCN